MRRKRLVNAARGNCGRFSFAKSTRLTSQALPQSASTLQMFLFVKSRYIIRDVRNCALSQLAWSVSGPKLFCSDRPRLKRRTTSTPQMAFPGSRRKSSDRNICRGNLLNPRSNHPELRLTTEIWTANVKESVMRILADSSTAIFLAWLRTNNEGLLVF